MARRKNAYMSDGSDSDASMDSGSDAGFNSQEDEDSRAERALFEHKPSKRRRTGANGKAAAWEGIFGEEEEAPRRFNGGGIGSRAKGSKHTKTDWTKAPTFVSKSSTEQQEDAGSRSKADTPDDEASNPSDSGDNTNSGSEDDSDSPSRPASPRVKENDYDDNDDDENEKTTSGIGSRGLGFRQGGQGSVASEQKQAPRGGIGSRGIGSRGGIGSSASRPSPFSRAEDGSSSTQIKSDESSQPQPPRERSAFARRDVPTPPPQAQQPALTAQEAAHFRKIENNFGSKFLQKFGWAAGEGLGKDKSGRAVPVEAVKVMRGHGISSGMRPEGSKREARRRGEAVSDDEEEKRQKARGSRNAGQSKEKKQPGDSWRKQRKVKVKVEHKTYEQLLSEAGETSAGVGLVIDARGGELKEVESLSALNLSGWTPTSDATQLPELRHNLRLIVDVAKADVEALVKEGRTINEKRRWAVREEQIARNTLDDSAKESDRLAQIQVHIADIATLASAEANKPHPSLDVLTPSFDALLNDFEPEYVALELDEVIVGAIAQVLRSTLAEWKPFDVSSDVLLASLKSWRRAYRLPIGDAEENRTEGRTMTAWESFLWGSWLPKVRSAINNDWSPNSPHSAVHLIEAWAPILPSFIRDNMLDQLILPKVRQSIEEWDSRPSRSGKTRSLSSIVFPWLPLLDYRVDEILDGAKRRLRQVLRKWTVRDGVPEELGRWRRDIFTSKEWDELMLRNVVPKLGVCLRDDFVVNPRKQDMTPLEEWTLPWHGLVRSSTFSQLLEVNFFPKWLDILYIWLIQPNFKADEVANWFTWWKSRFPEDVLGLPGVAYGFTSGLELMQEAMRLGPEAPSRLKKAAFNPPKTSKEGPKTSKPAPVHRQEPQTADITFRTLAEDVAAQNDLIFLALGISHTQTGKPLFKVCKNVDGRGGITVYIGDDAVFAQAEDGIFRAISLDDMVKRALA